MGTGDNYKYLVCILSNYTMLNVSDITFIGCLIEMNDVTD